MNYITFSAFIDFIYLKLARIKFRLECEGLMRCHKEDWSFTKGERAIY